VAIERAFSGLEPAGRRARDLRWDARDGVVAIGTLACPECDAPVALGPRPASPADPVACPVCATAGALRDFLSFDAPARPARVVVRVVLPPSAAGR